MNDRFKILRYLSAVLPADFPWDYFLGKGTSISRLFSAITNDLVNSDREAVEQLYTGSESRYYTVKSRLLAKVISVFASHNLDERDHSKVAALKHRCNQYKTSAEFLILTGERAKAMQLIRFQGGALFKAIEIGKTETVVWCLKELHTQYSLMGQEYEMRKIEEQLESYTQILKFEYVAIRATNQFRCKVQGMVGIEGDELSLGKLSVDTTTQCLRQAKNLNSKYCNFTLFQQYFLCRKLYFEITENFKDLESLCAEYIAYLKDHKVFATSAILGVVHLVKSNAHYRLGQFESGAKMGKIALIQFSKNGRNWLSSAQCTLLNLVHIGAWEEASKLLDRVLKKKLKDSSFVPREFFTGVSIAIDLIARFGIWDSDAAMSDNAFRYTNNGRLKLGIISNLKYLSRDKHGYNLSLIQMKLLLLLQQILGEETISRTDDEQYFKIATNVAKDLKKIRANRLTVRISYSLEFLIQLKDGIDSIEVLNQQIEYYSNQLKNATSKSRCKRDAIEIIPCEDVFLLVRTMYCSVKKA